MRVFTSSRLGRDPGSFVIPFDWKSEVLRSLLVAAITDDTKLSSSCGFNLVKLVQNNRRQNTGR